VPKININDPLPNVANGGDQHGRFVRGNKGGPGNPLARQVAALRFALTNAVTPADFRAIAKKLVSLAKAGDTTAARVLFDRTIGLPMAADEEQRIARLEEFLLEEDET